MGLTPPSTTPQLALYITPGKRTFTAQMTILLENHEWQLTFKTIPKQSCRFCGRPKIKLQIAPRP